jgi:hypothetical protein
MSICFCFSSSVNIQRTHHMHNFWYLKSARITCTYSCKAAISFAVACWNVTILLNHFINVISMSLFSCCSWSPAMLLVIQVGMTEVCIMDTYAAQCRAVLMSTQSFPLTTFICQRMSSGGTFSAIKNLITEHCLFHTDIVSSHCAIFMAVIQRPPVAELWNFAQKCQNV